MPKGVSTKPKPTHCKRGHEFTAENTKIQIGSNGRTWRGCRKCKNAAVKAHRGPVMRERIADLTAELDAARAVIADNDRLLGEVQQQRDAAIRSGEVSLQINGSLRHELFATQRERDALAFQRVLTDDAPEWVIKCSACKGEGVIHAFFSYGRGSPHFRYENMPPPEQRRSKCDQCNGKGWVAPTAALAAAAEPETAPETQE